jgi:DNA-binding response OmpR family regulator
MNQPTPHVLVVEDNRALNRVVQTVLQNAGYQVSVAHDGEAAWALARDRNFDLIITDQQMPKLGGVEFCHRIRQSEGANRSTRIFMLTAKGLELDLAKLKTELNITDVFAKPFSPSELMAAVGGCWQLMSTERSIEQASD